MTTRKRLRMGLAKYARRQGRICYRQFVPIEQFQDKYEGIKNGKN